MCLCFLTRHLPSSTPLLDMQLHLYAILCDTLIMSDEETLRKEQIKKLNIVSKNLLFFLFLSYALVLMFTANFYSRYAKFLCH